MVVAVLADELAKQELQLKGIPSQTEFIWADSVRSLTIIEADVYFDLLFEYDHERIAQLKKLLPKPVFVNSVIHTGKELTQPFIRINAWPTFINRNITELALTVPQQEQTVKNIFNELGWQYQLVPDTAGLVTPRIIAMIINEAWYTLGDEISTKQEIDTAMKLGTNYPYGPFEWGEKIGIERIKELLKSLAKVDSRYTVAPALLNQK